MKILFLIGTFLVLAAAVPSLKEKWELFKKEHRRSYLNPRQEHERLEIFTNNLKKIEEHNREYAIGLVSYRMKVNRFSDLRPEEVREELNGLMDKSGQLKKHGLQYLPPANAELPESVDWREKGAVTPVKNQGRCGGCWAFSATGALEGQIFRKSGKLVSLSEQQLIDCSRDYGNKGCRGGLMDQAFEYINKAGGLDSEESYPYEGYADICRFNGSEKVEGTSIRSYIDLPEGDEKALKAAVATVGPISVAVSAGNSGFLYYDGGIFSGDTCDSDSLDHGVLLVGYGSENGEDYWIIKNSWSTSWGEKGYLRLARNKDNVCGIASMASYPVL